LLFVLHRMLERLTGGWARIVPYALYAQPIGRGKFSDVREDPVTVVSTVGMDSPLIELFPRPRAVIRQRYAGGAECHVALVKGEFAGYIWIRNGYYDEDEVRCKYLLAEPETTVWDFDVYVAQRYRFGRTLARLWKAVDRQLAARGVTWSFSRISLFNRGSIGAHERLDAVRLGHALFIVLGPVQCAWLPSAPFVHLSLNERSRPEIQLRAPRPSREAH
jgi:hypothetical protein